jgi:hypothetical protein
MPAKLSQARRDAILSDVQAGLMGCRAIAAKHDVSSSTVSLLAKTEIGPEAFARLGKQRATMAFSVDSKAKRQALEQRFLDECAAFLDELHIPHLVYSFGGKENTYAEHTLPAPDSTAKRNLMVSAAVAMDKAIAIARHDTASSDGVTEVAVWVRTHLGAGAGETRTLIQGEVIA